MDHHRLAAAGITVDIDLAVGHIADLAIEGDGSTLRPLHRAAWADGTDGSVPPNVSPGVARLSGDFLCAPFSRNDIEEAPAHGWPGNSAWQLIAEDRRAGMTRATFRLQRKVFGAAVDKIVTLRDGHPFLYQEHVFTGGAGGLNVAHHAMSHMAAGGILSFSPKRLALTPETPLEPDPSRGRYLLAYPASADRLDAFPLAAGGTTDLTHFPPGSAHEDFVVLVEAGLEGLGWCALARHAERDLVLVLKDPAELPVTMLWMSNGGRDYAPWNGRHTGVLGIEEGRTAMGHRASLGDNEIRRAGVPTAFDLKPDGRFSVRQAIGAVPLPGGAEKVVSMVPGKAFLDLVLAGGGRLALPYDTGFLSGTS